MDTPAEAGYAASWTTEGTSGENTVTEAEWLECTEPEKMLEFLRDSGSASDRKLRLFGCACCRRVWHHMDKYSRMAIGLAEKYTDATAARWKRVWYKVTTWPGGGWWEAGGHRHGRSRMAAFLMVNRSVGVEDLMEAKFALSGLEEALQGVAQCHLLHDLFGNPFGLVALDPAWLSWHGGTVVKLAHAAYEERHLPAGTLDNGRLAVLGDALEEAGCTDSDILGHLRGPGPHVRGCWAVDLILGKE